MRSTELRPRGNLDTRIGPPWDCSRRTEGPVKDAAESHRSRSAIFSAVGHDSVVAKANESRRNTLSQLPTV